MPTYDELKSELMSIAEILAKYPESIQSKVYDILIESFINGHIAPSNTDDFQLKASLNESETIEDEKPSVPPEKPNKSKKGNSAKKSSESYQIDRNLNLRGNAQIPDFRDFVEQKKPGKSNQAFNTVAIYYLKKLLELDVVTLDHIYTCYKEMNRKPNDKFRQSFIDTKNRQGWIEFEENKLDISHRGVIFVEHDLPPATEAQS